MIAFHANVNGDSINEWKEVHGIPFHKVELLCAQHQAERAEIYIALVDELCVGYMVCHHFADSVLFVRQIFVYPEWENNGIGSALVRSIGKPVAKVIFQTRKEKEPEILLKHVFEHAKKISETDKMITWEMEWKNGC